jgi:hypothetical protein
MAGVPAKPLKQLTDKDATLIKVANKGYAELAKSYKAQGLDKR